MLGTAIGKPRPIVSVPRWLGMAVAWTVGRFVGDVVLTRTEIDALMDDLLATDGPATGSTALSAWAEAHASSLGTLYGHELARRVHGQRARGSGLRREPTRA
jgi:hypothetical protein